jgi:indole-3-glycerol phosphate synthase
LIIIAEVKTHSPFGPVTNDSNQSWDELFELANKVGDIISIHTDPRWQGSFDLVRKARKLTDKPILAKGIHATDDEVRLAVKAGADYVLVVGRYPRAYQRRCMIEPKSIEELRTIPNWFKIVWNSRDLDTGGLKTETFEKARNEFSGWLCQASNIRTKADILPGADAVLVGTHLLEFANSLN